MKRMASLTSVASKRKSVFIYKGEGVNEKEPEILDQRISSLLDKSLYDVLFITPEQIIDGSWREAASLLVIGGGYDLGLIRALGCKGKNQIRDFVRSGGSYLGICSGAYFGCSYIEFDRNGPQEVVGERRLKFYPGGCIGPQFSDYQYNSYSGCRAVLIDFHFKGQGDDKGQRSFRSHFNGGGAFFPFGGQQTRLTDEHYNQSNSSKNDVIDLNTEHNKQQHERNEQLVKTTQNGCVQSLDPLLTKNGHKFRFPTLHNKFSVSDPDVSDVEILSRYLEMPGRCPAIVKTKFGKGTTVLSGVHFEYMIDNLDRDDPYLTNVLPETAKSETLRKQMFSAILNYLGCSCL